MSCKACLERPDRHVLLVKWRRLEDHTEGFRQSTRYQEWRQLLHHFYATTPLVEHYRLIEPQARHLSGRISWFYSTSISS